MLQELELPDTRTGKPGIPQRLHAKRAKAPVARALPDTIDDRKANAAAELGGIPNSLGVMLFGIAYIVTAMAFTAVTYIRAVMWQHEGIIGYPVLLLVVTITISLFIILPWAIFRKRSNVPTIGALLRHIHSKSRRAH